MSALRLLFCCHYRHAILMFAATPVDLLLMIRFRRLIFTRHA